MQSHGQHEDHGHDDGDDVEGDHGVRSLVPAGEHGGVAELHEEDVDDPHGAQQQGLYCDWKTEEYRGGQVTEIERDQLGQRAEQRALLCHKEPAKGK